MKYLVVAAHPDDEILGCGATMARLASEGHEVHIRILGEGATSRKETRHELGAELTKLHSDSKRAASEVRATSIEVGSLPDNQFDSVPLLSVVKKVENMIESIQPDTIFTHFGGDLNIDHTITSRAVLTATRPVASTCVKELYFFEVPSATEWSFQRYQGGFVANMFYNVSGFVESKVRAMACYESESRAFPHPRSEEALRAIAARWGSVVGCAAAEAFSAVRCIR